MTTTRQVPVPFKPVGWAEWMRRMRINWECGTIDYRRGTKAPLLHEGRYFDYEDDSAIAFDAEILGRPRMRTETVRTCIVPDTTGAERP